MKYRDSRYSINKHPVFFFVNNNIVVAKLMDHCKNDAILSGNQFLDTFWISRKDKDTLLMTDHPYATAKCDPRDTFDEDYGKWLAYERLKVAYWSQYENRLGKINDFLLKKFEQNSDLMTKVSEKYLLPKDE